MGFGHRAGGPSPGAQTLATQRDQPGDQSSTCNRLIWAAGSAARMPRVPARDWWFCAATRCPGPGRRGRTAGSTWRGAERADAVGGVPRSRAGPHGPAVPDLRRHRVRVRVPGAFRPRRWAASRTSGIGPPELRRSWSTGASASLSLLSTRCPFRRSGIQAVRPGPPNPPTGECPSVAKARIPRAQCRRSARPRHL
jgi:hypothetical protein